ncbi:TonB-dependent receptor [Emcibacter sp. SYSU 3D8]|uniref:TonB-dependent receptor n=1 Tax=Emcibacter sp. SYSU 3D8 TaxID=3133969 RepID=UPI0031FE65FC
MFGFKAIVGISISAAFAIPAFAHTEDKKENIEQVVVWGRAFSLAGKAFTASEGIVGYSDLSKRPILRAGELVEVIPGMIATQHSGTGKANQYFLRGFNLDHGTDFAARFEGMPVNMPTHGHGQGYLDLNFIIPEIVEYVSYEKGPYHADVGDFSSAGSAAFKTYDRLGQGFVHASIGNQGYYRLVAADSMNAAGGTLLLAGEAHFYGGPWELDENLEKFNALMKYTGEVGGADTQFIATAYRALWDSTDQVPLRAVDGGLIPRKGFIDPDLGGQTTRLSLSGRMDWGRLEAQVYGIYYRLNLFSNFTYFLEDPVNGDQFEQADERAILGGSLSWVNDVTLGAMPVTIRAGLDLRYDDIMSVGLFHTAGRERIGTVRDDKVQELMVSLHGEAELHLSDRLRAIFGARVDWLSWDVAARSLPVNSGDGDDAILSPKGTLAWRVADGLELYASYGRGFHSNDVRGATISIDPKTGEPVGAVPALVRSDGAELGLRVEANDRLSVTVAGFWLDLQSELVFVGDAGATEPNEATRRYGIEASAFWKATDWLVFDLSGAMTRARFRNVDDDRIPNSVGFVLGGGAVVTLPEGFTASLRVRHLGNAPLIEGNSMRSRSTTLVNAGLSYDFGEFEVGLELLNILNSRDNDITYFYESRLRGETAGVEDVHFHPVEPLTIRGSVRVKF